MIENLVSNLLTLSCLCTVILTFCSGVARQAKTLEHVFVSSRNGPVKPDRGSKITVNVFPSTTSARCRGHGLPILWASLSTESRLYTPTESAIPAIMPGCCGWPLFALSLHADSRKPCISVSATDFDLACSCSSCMAGEKSRAEYATFTAVSGLSPETAKTISHVYMTRSRVITLTLAHVNYVQERGFKRRLFCHRYIFAYIISFFLIAFT